MMSFITLSHDFGDPECGFTNVRKERIKCNSYVSRGYCLPKEQLNAVY
jgi:hypothetical protein